MQQTRKNVICSVLALLLALTALTALAYNMMYRTSNTLIEWAENGFSLMDFRSDMISYQTEESGLLTAIGNFLSPAVPLFLLLTPVQYFNAYRARQKI